MWKRQIDGYRYIRSYDVQNGTVRRYALWERQNGRMRRVGTAWHINVAEAWLFKNDPCDRVRFALNRQKVASA